MENNRITYKKAIKDSMELLMLNPNVVFLGYNVKYGNQAYGTLVDIPQSRLIETPVAENLMLSMAIGMSLEGYLPVVYFERFDFILNAMDALVNHLDKLEKLSHGEFIPKVLIRVVIGGKKKPLYTGPTHIQDFTKQIKSFVNFPVIKLPLSYHRIIDVYYKALNSNNIIIEEKDLYERII